MFGPVRQERSHEHRDDPDDRSSPARDAGRSRRARPSLDELRRLTEVPDRRVVFRGVDWSFYEKLVDSIPEGSNIHVNYDGRDLEIMAKGSDHEDWGACWIG